MGDGKNMDYRIVARIVTLVSIATLGGSLAPILQAQDDGYVERRGSGPSSFFGRFFSPSAPKRQTIRTPRETPSMGGLFVPLKSFSNAIRGRGGDGDDVVVDGEETQSTARTPKEPFEDTPDYQGAGSDSNAASEERGESSAPPMSKMNPAAPPKPTATSAPTRLSLSGSSAARAPNPPPSPVGPKSFEANPKKDTIDTKGTSRRSTPGPVDTTMVKPRKPSSPKPDVSKPTAPESPIPESRDSESRDPELRDPELRASPITPPAPKAIAAPTAPNSATRSAATRTAVLASRSTVIPANDSPAKPMDRVAASEGKGSEGIGSGGKGIDLQSPGLRIQLVGPESILIGQNVGYEVIATNDGPGVLQDLIVRLLVPDKVHIGDAAPTEGECEKISEPDGKGVAWGLSRLAAGTSKTMRVMIRADEAEHFAMSLDWTLAYPSVQLQVRVQQPQLQLALEGPSEVDFGSPQIYRLRVRNPGNADAQGVKVELAAEPYGSNQSEIGDIPPGSERVVEVELTFQQAGRLPIRAKALSQTANLESVSSIDVDVRQSQLVATWIGPTEFFQGNTADYVLTIENRGAIAAIKNACHIQIPLGVDVVQLPKGVSRSGDQLRWDIASIAPHESLEFAFQCAMNKMGENAFVFQVESSSGEPAEATVRTLVDAIADLQLSVNDPIAPAPVGQPVTYEITIANRGKKSAEDVFVIAQFSEGVEPTRVDGHTGKLIPGQAIFDAIPIIGPGERIVLRITAEAAKPGTHRFRAAVRCQGTEDDLLKEESTRYTASSASKERK
jgi:uncharacterized repeat protein (TIGR01451 family)